MNYDTHKSGAIIIKDRKLLITRSKGKGFFVAPGGKLEKDETSVAALSRELNEELSIVAKEGDMEFFGTFYAPMISDPTRNTRMDVYTLNRYSGEIIIANEIEELKWVDSTWVKDPNHHSIFDQEVIPRLKERNLID